MFIHQQDAETFERFLGTPEVPKKYVREYWLRLNLYHKDGNSGPLGTLAVIECLRFSGWKPPHPADEPEEETNWDTVNRGARVEARFGGAWAAGEFVGFGENRVLLVRLDDDEFIKECRRDMVRVAADQTPRVVAPVAEEKEVLPPDPDDAEYADVMPDSPVPFVPPSQETPAWQSKDTDWAQVTPGDAVWVEINEEPLDGTFVSVASDGQVIVLVEGQEHTVASEAVIHAAPAAV